MIKKTSCIWRKESFQKNVIEFISKDFSFLSHATQDRKVHSALSFQISRIRKSFERSSSNLYNPAVTHVPIPNKREVSCRFLCLLRPYFPLCLLQPALRAGYCKNFWITGHETLKKCTGTKISTLFCRSETLTSK